MSEARALKLCTKEDYIKSGQRDDKSPLKGAWFCTRDPFFVCTAVELEQNIHCTLGDLLLTVSWTSAIEYHTSDGRRWYSAYTKA